jgi:hypothetical protein
VRQLLALHPKLPAAIAQPHCDAITELGVTFGGRHLGLLAIMVCHVLCLGGLIGVILADLVKAIPGSLRSSPRLSSKVNDVHNLFITC